MDNDLNLAIFESEPLPPTERSVDEINNLIEDDYLLFFDRDAYEKEKKSNSVNIVFSLGD
ncbi:MAG: hypothetical protein PHC61_13415 [Chitinivibrionales bacterium]|nr:hypothetical protein [Chitinivibrionales bacterium]